MERVSCWYTMVMLARRCVVIKHDSASVHAGNLLMTRIESLVSLALFTHIGDEHKGDMGGTSRC